MKKSICFLLIVLLLVAAGVTAFAAGEYVTTRQAGYQNILFSNGYRGFCIDYHKDSARNGEGFIVAENTSIADNNLTHEDISGLLKAMFVHCFDTVFAKSGNTYVIRNAETVQFAIWKLTDDLNFNDQQAYALVDAVKAYDGPEIPDHGYTLYLENGDEVIFDFIVVTPKNSNTQNFFAYKLTVVRHEHDYGDWETDVDSHWKECSCGDITEEGKHTGGEANCHEQAECEACGASYGQVDKTNHDGETEVRGAKPATTEEEGYTGDTYCLGCDEMIEKGEVIPKLHRHDYGDWETDVDSHWKECSCGDITEEGKHAGGEANCHEQAECETCGKAYGQVDKTNHDGETELRGAKPATTEEEGYSGDTYCLGCDEMIEKGEVIPKLHRHDYGDWENDETSHWKECSCGDITEEGKHAGGEANCHEQAECETCGTSYGQVDKTNHDGDTEVRGAKPATENESGYTGDTYCLGCEEMIKKGELIPALHDHDYGEDWETDEQSHWHECACGAAADEGDHAGGKANCHALAVCETCGKAYGELDFRHHDGETEIRDVKAATEYEAGYTGDTYCLGCNEKIAEGEVIPALHQHSFGSTWEMDEDSHWHACKCGAQSDFAAHTYVNGICSVCGHVQRGGAADVPKTSDTFRYGLWAAHLLLSLSALACVLCIRKRSKA